MNIHQKERIFFFHSCDYNTFSFYILRMSWEINITMIRYVFEFCLLVHWHIYCWMLTVTSDAIVTYKFETSLRIQNQEIQSRWFSFINVPIFWVKGLVQCLASRFSYVTRVSRPWNALFSSRWEIQRKYCRASERERK